MKHRKGQQTRDYSGNSRGAKVTLAICTYILHQSYCPSHRAQKLLPALLCLPHLGPKALSLGQGWTQLVLEKGSEMPLTPLTGRGLTSKLQFVLMYRRFSVFCLRPSNITNWELISFTRANIHEVKLLCSVYTVHKKAWEFTTIKQTNA